MRRASLLALAFAAASACGGEPGGRGGETASSAEKHESKVPYVPGKKFDYEHRWDLSDPVAVKRLAGTKFGEQEINEFWTRKGWRLSQHEEQYMATVKKLVDEGKVTRVSHWGQTPFDGIYQTLTTVTLEGKTIEPQTEFWMEFCENEDELNVGKPRFLRVSEYEEEHQGHIDQASDKNPGERRAGRHVDKHDDDKD